MRENVTSGRILLGAAEFVYSEITDPRGLIVKCSLVVRYQTTGAFSCGSINQNGVCAIENM